MESEPDIVTVHVGANDLTKQVNSPNSFKKILKSYNKI